MTRSHLALFILLSAPVALYVAVVLPREIPKDYGTPTSPTVYFPDTVGTKWVYKLTRHGPFRRHEAIDEIEMITAATERDGERFVTVRQLEGDSPNSLREYWLSESGVRSRSLSDPIGDYWMRQRQPGPWIAGLPARIVNGETWTYDLPADRSRTVSTIAGWETVRVPAGAYRALRVNSEITRAGFKTRVDVVSVFR